jgi:arylsulfatase A-like enzyme
MKRREAISLLAGSALAACNRSKAARPNVVFILVDDLRWDELACTGHPFVRTPNIDRLAKEGMMFSNAFLTTPLCSPSRANFLTGQYAHINGIIDNTARVARSHQLVTFPRLLQGNGYETAYVGKWHMGNDDSPRPGFDRWVSFRGQGEYFDPELNEDGKRVKAPGYVTDIFNDRAVEFVRRPRNKPFCLYLAHKALHPNMIQHDDGSVSAPAIPGFTPAERHKSLYADEPLPRRPSYGQPPRDKPALARKIGNLPPLGPATVTDDETIRNRLRLLMPVEEGVGRILQTLEQTGQLDDTVVIFASDNGYFYGEHGLSEERRLAYEESIRTPLLVRYPRLIRAGAVRDEFALNIDIAPTLLELAGSAIPANMQGRSLAPLLEGRQAPWRESFLIEYFSDRVFPRVLNMGYQAVRTDRAKYIHYVDLQGMDELYDLKADPYEMANVIAQPQTQELLRRMKEELQRLVTETGGTQI